MLAYFIVYAIAVVFSAIMFIRLIQKGVYKVPDDLKMIILILFPMLNAVIFIGLLLIDKEMPKSVSTKCAPPEELSAVDKMKKEIGL